MNSHKLEAYLLASRPADGSYSHFTQSVIRALSNSTHAPSHKRPKVWHAVRAYMQPSAPHKAAALALVIVAVAFIGLSGYAYATGTNPFSLIKRWVAGGQVKVVYQDPQTNKQREFSHGTKRTYSDMAVSAFAELSLIDLLHFHATNTYTVPKNGIEYIDNPFRTEYVYQRIGTIEQVSEAHIVLHLTYNKGQSKIEPSREIDERVTIPRAQLYYYKDGTLSTVQPSSVGQLVEVYQDHYLRHTQHSGKRPIAVDLYSVFAVSHSLEAIKEATTTKGPARATTDEQLGEEISQQDLYELGVGAYSKNCLGNGADVCPHAFRDEHAGDNFFSANITPGHYGGPSRQNPNTILYGEAVATLTAEILQYQARQIEGRITEIVGDRITIKTSSGALWTFQYSAVNQTKFAAAYGRPLKVGELLAGSVLASVYTWDQRNFDNQYVAGMSRYR